MQLYFSKVIIQKVLQLCSKGSLPIAIDHPESVKDVNRLIIDLYNGAQGGTKGSGVQIPTAGALISANFKTWAISEVTLVRWVTAVRL